VEFGKAWKRIGISTSVLLLLLLAGIIVIYWKSSTTVVLVVRHAERNDPAPGCAASATCPLPNGNPANPPISAVGQTRRDELAHVVEDTGIQAIYASCFCRTQQTVETTATNRGLTTIIVPQQAADGSVDIADLIAQINNNNTGQKVLVAGHTSTVPAIIDALGGGGIDPIAENEFDNLYVVTIVRWWWVGKRVRVVRLKYGAAT